MQRLCSRLLDSLLFPAPLRGAYDCLRDGSNLNKEKSPASMPAIWVGSAGTAIFRCMGDFQAKNDFGLDDFIDL